MQQIRVQQIFHWAHRNPGRLRDSGCSTSRWPGSIYLGAFVFRRMNTHLSDFLAEVCKRTEWVPVPRNQLTPAIVNDPERAESVVLKLPGKGLARYLRRGSVRFQPLPIGTAREVFPQAARPVGFVERVMHPVARRRLSRNHGLLAKAGQSSPSTVPGPRKGIRYSIAAIQH